ncbi:MAG: YfiR family protein [Crocinitomicaceae bacterium]
MLKSPNYCTSLKLLCLIPFIIFGQNGQARESEDIISSKANFILEIAYNVYYGKPSNNKTYDIGIYGRDSESKAIFSKLDGMVENLTIDGKPINIKLFKTMRSVIPVDAIYVSGNTKIRLGDLHDKLSANSYSMITENYPYGSSAINFSLDKNDQIIFEIQETALRNNGATVRRKLLKNRQRIASAKEWDLAIEKGNNQSKTFSPSGHKAQNEGIASDSIEIDTNIIETEAPVIESQKDTCNDEIQSAVQSANIKTKWISIIALLVIGGMGFYIFKLRKDLASRK